MRHYSFILIGALLLLSSCASKPGPSISSFYTKEIECAGKDAFGNESYYVTITHNSKKEATFKAQERALHVMLFEGHLDNLGQCTQKPILGGSNRYEKNKAFFDGFFKKKRSYRKYTDTTLLTTGSAQYKQGEKQQTYRFKVTVDRQKLEKKLEKKKLK